ncbi:endonuclease [Psychroflexus aestuariivivens]|uniref:endonuclease n=1 Tax=Psychroflexus aestuariivivens TaxID=1795040 RepID=UPI000FD720F6|nr:endonuclease [Psychroflexus aestuariivivens]
MKFTSSTFALLAFIFTLQLSAQAPTGYYDDANGLTGFELKSALNQIIDDIDDNNGFPSHQDQGYDALYSAYAGDFSGDTDNYYEEDGTVLDMYSEQPNSSDSYNYNHFSNQCGNYDGEGVCYNREHLVPQSTFNSASPMKNDYFHVIPTDGSVNGARGSFPFGEVDGSVDYTSTNGSKRGPNTFPGYSGTVFEPIDEFKGDIARSVLYFAIRYENEFSSGWDDNDVLANDSEQFYDQWYIDLLISWHISDPVSQKEIDRNENGFNFQGNRNPLIDQPEFVDLIWNPDPDTEAPTAPMNLAANNIDSNSFTLSWDASTDNIAVNSYQIEQDNVIIGQVVGDVLSFDVIDLEPETLYNYRVYAIDVAGNVSDASENLEVTTTEEPNFLLEEDFEDCTTVDDNFVPISELSNLDWECTTNFGENNSGAYQMNSYNNGQVPSLDWLVTSYPLNFSQFENANISFYAIATFGNSALELLYSEDYDGSDNPSDFTWLSVPNITIPLHPDGSNTEVEFIFENVDISNIPGDAYLAFRYDTTSGEDATRWTVDNVMVEGINELTSTAFEKVSFKLFPNPNRQNSVNLVFEQAVDRKIEVFNINGQKLLTKYAEGKTLNLDISRLKSGVYLFKINQNGISEVKKLIKR